MGSCSLPWCEVRAALQTQFTDLRSAFVLNALPELFNTDFEYQHRAAQQAEASPHAASKHMSQHVASSMYPEAWSPGQVTATPDQQCVVSTGVYMLINALAGRYAVGVHAGI